MKDADVTGLRTHLFLLGNGCGMFVSYYALIEVQLSIIGAAVAVEADVPSVVVVWYCRGGKRGGACATTEVLSGVDSPSRSLCRLQVPCHGGTSSNTLQACSQLCN